MIRRVEEARLIVGLAGMRTINITKLQYADDILIFRPNDIRQAPALKLGLRINLNKSSLIWLEKNALSPCFFVSSDARTTHSP